MPDLTFDFTWYKDAKGYRLIPAKPLKLQPGQPISDVPARDIRPARIVRNGGALQSYRPLDDFPNLVRYFIGMPQTEAGVLEFIQRFGPLTYDGLQKDGEVVPTIIDNAIEMSQAARGHLIAMPLNKLNASIVTEQNSMRLKISPVCLLDALWLQLAQARSNGTGFRKCENRKCGKTFIAGVSGDRRRDARFCSDECRVQHNSLERSKH